MNKIFFNSNKFIFAIILFMVPVSQASIDIYSPSMPHIVNGLNTTESKVQLTISLFLLSLGVGQYLYGAISDSIGRKKSLLIGMFLFTISSLACYYSTNIEILILARFFQGLGAASIAVLSKAVSVDLYDGIALMKASAWVGLIWGVAPIVAPVIGGYLDEFGGWRLSFLVLAIYGFISCLFIILFMPETNKKFQKFNFNYILKTSFIILKNKDFMGSTLIIATTNLGLFVFTLMAPFLIQNILGKSQIFFGYMALVIGSIYILGAFLSNYAIRNFESDKIINLVSKMLLLIGIIMVFVSFLFPKSIWVLMLTSSLFAFSSGFLYPFLVGRMFAPFQNIAGMVSANYGIVSYTFSGIISIVISCLKITSLIEISYAYCLVGIITYLSMRFMFKFSFK
ncbi:Bcr/CflA family efflux MFS transporter [Silvanigrella paludirubra]|uniref:Bcr/CflA family efflux MFS transporter n=1 Tax=Silvanigrella paludirubra TaxID=2499159 RepID=A0A6N6VU42_9BACT|nr:multidrug effflux MFS transporter [Silvanigrella paludirubra]KAB8039855.1 Bcr/CflA family efflux MFS transporter [Silvanigrella paludirubra]